jgi:serine/threonine-protein kinase
VPGYISPERADVARASGAGDQYALACILFELLTGALPFEGTTMDLQIAARIAGDLRRLADVRPERQWPVTLQEAFRQALAPSAVDRFPSVVGFVDAAAYALGVLELMHSPDQVEEFPEGMTSLTARLQRPAPTSVPPDATVRDLDATDAPVSALRAVSVLVLGGLAMVLSAGLWIRAAAARP